MSPWTVRLGHAIRDDVDRGGADAVSAAVSIVAGATSLDPRVPTDRAAVDATEQALGILAAARPLYAYIGDLNPSLGTVGLVMERSWCRELTGVTRCDSGGLGGRRGAFAVLTESEALAALGALSFAGSALPGWDSEFANEVDTSYPAAEAYVTGVEPDVSAWKDARATCVANAAPPCDRRLWTWEARLGTGPRVDEIVALVLSPAASKQFADLIERDSALDIPDRVKILAGDIDAEGAHFHAPRVRAVLGGH